MFAIIKTGGKQLMVSEKDIVYIEKLDAKDGQKVYFTEVIMIDDKVGNPTLKSAVVVGKVIKQGKGKKIRVIRYHPKKNINKVYGHRQPYTKVEIETISLAGTGITVPTEKKHIHEPHAKKPFARKTAKVVEARPLATKAPAVKKTVAAKPVAAKKTVVAKPAVAKKTVAAKPTAAKAPAVKKATAKAPAKK